MKVFRELTISGNPEQFDKLIATIERILGNGWTRNLEGEKNLKDVQLEGYFFTCTAQVSRHAADLFLVKEPGELQVANIVPIETGQLSHDEYNAILLDFHDTLVVPASRGLAVKITLTADHRDVTDWVSPQTAVLLERFSGLANKSALHALDEQRWIRFIIATHEENSNLGGHTLGRWLIEEKLWPSDRASNLVSQYEFARELLRAYDSAK